MDLTSLKAVLSELRKEILPSRFEKAQQPDPSTLQLGLRTLKGLKWIEISWDGEVPRLVEINPPIKCGTDSTLAKQLQYGLKNLALIKLHQKGFERIVHFELAKRPKDPLQKVLVFELMGRHSNLFLLDKNQKIITMGRQVRKHQSRLRPLSTGDIYSEPPSLKGIAPNEEETFERWKERLSLLPINFKKALQDNYQGISPSLAMQLVHTDKEQASKILSLQVNKIPEDIWDQTYKRWCIWLHQINNDNLYLEFSGPTTFRFWNTNILSKHSLVGTSLKLGNYYRGQINLKKINQIHKKLDQGLTKLKESEERAIEKQKDLLSKIFEESSLQLKADEILCMNSPNKLQIQEAQKLYKQAKKLRRSDSIIKERILFHQQKLENIEESMSFLDDLFTNVWEDHTNKLNKLIELQNELEEYLLKSKRKSKTNHNKSSKKPLPLEIISPNGATIQIGRNHLQNELISIRKAKKGDLWFHVQECAGSHVVLKSSNKITNEADIQLAADFAALFSRAKGNKFAAVVMAPTETLKRIQGALPGTVSHQKGKSLWGQSERALQHISQNQVFMN